MKSYSTVKNQAETVFTLNRSKFICNLKNIENEEEAEAFIKEISDKYSDATHNCFAYILKEEGSVQKMSDAGEPQGTAGQPMLEVLKKNNLTKVCAVVSRYFGGIKLGAGGLVGAYTKAVVSAVEKAGTALSIYSVVYKAVLPYSLINKFSQGLASISAEISNTVYLDEVEITVFAPQEKEEKLISLYSEITNGNDKIELINKEYKLYN